MSPAPLDLELDTVDGGADLLIADLHDAGLRPEGEESGGSKAVIRLALPATEVDAAAALLQKLAGLRGFTGVAVRLSDAPGTGVFDSQIQQLIAVLDRAELSDGRGFRIAASDPTERQQWIELLSTATGWRSDPSDWVINFERTAAGAEQEGWIAQIGPLHWSRRTGRLKRLPWSTPGALADFLVRLAKLRAGHSLLDPCCGSGTILVSGGLAGAGELLGIDHDRDAAQVARENLAAVDLRGSIRVGDWLDGQPATKLSSGSIDRVISNLPFGKQVGSHQGNQLLYPTLIAEIARLLRPDGRAVLLTEDKRLFTDTVQRTRGIKIVKERTFRYSGATPSAYVISRRR